MDLFSNLDARDVDVDLSTTAPSSTTPTTPSKRPKRMDCDIMRVGPEPMPLVDPEPMPLVDKTAIARLCKVGVCGCEIPPENYDLCENHAVTEGMLRSCNIPVKWLRENRLENYLTSLAVLSSIVPLQEQERVTGNCLLYTSPSPRDRG